MIKRSKNQFMLSHHSQNASTLPPHRRLGLKIQSLACLLIPSAEAALIDNASLGAL